MGLTAMHVFRDTSLRAAGRLSVGYPEGLCWLAVPPVAPPWRGNAAVRQSPQPWSGQEQRHWLRKNTWRGDCADCAGLREIAKGADTLVLACTRFGSPPISPAIADVITGTPEVASIAQEAGTRRVVLTHMSPSFANPGVKERAVAEVARSCGGAILCPDELTTIGV